MRQEAAGAGWLRAARRRDGDVDTGVRVAERGDVAEVLDVVEHDFGTAYVVKVNGVVTDAYPHEIAALN